MCVCVCLGRGGGGGFGGGEMEERRKRDRSSAGGDAEMWMLRAGPVLRNCAQRSVWPSRNLLKGRNQSGQRGWKRNGLRWDQEQRREWGGANTLNAWSRGTTCFLHEIGWAGESWGQMLREWSQCFGSSESPVLTVSCVTSECLISDPNNFWVLLCLHVFCEKSKWTIPGYNEILFINHHFSISIIQSSALICEFNQLSLQSR